MLYFLYKLIQSISLAHGCKSQTRFSQATGVRVWYAVCAYNVSARKIEAEDPKFKVILSYIKSLRS